MTDAEKRIEVLEQKVAVLEVEAQERRKMQEQLQELIDSGAKILLKFAEDYGIKTSAVQKLRQRE